MYLKSFFFLKYLYDELNKLRPNLVNLATECDENDESIGDILRTNDQCERIINQYRSIFDKSSSSFLKFSDDVKLVNLSHSLTPDDFASKPLSTNHTQSMNTFAQNEDLIGNFSGIENGHKSNSTITYDPLKELQDLFITPNENNISLNNNNTSNMNAFETSIIPNSLSGTLTPMLAMQKSLGGAQMLENKSLDESSKFAKFNKI
jgi:hypothetical protein